MAGLVKIHKMRVLTGPANQPVEKGGEQSITRLRESLAGLAVFVRERVSVGESDGHVGKPRPNRLPQTPAPPSRLSRIIPEVPLASLLAMLTIAEQLALVVIVLGIHDDSAAAPVPSQRHQILPVPLNLAPTPVIKPIEPEILIPRGDCDRQKKFPDTAPPGLPQLLRALVQPLRPPKALAENLPAQEVACASLAPHRFLRIQSHLHAQSVKRHWLNLPPMPGHIPGVRRVPAVIDDFLGGTASLRATP